MGVKVQSEHFDAGALLNQMHAANCGIGAVASFVGYVRDFNDGLDVYGMFLEHYPGMTERSLQAIAEQASTRWSLLSVEIVHRVGRLEPGEPIVFVAASSAHRLAAFEACQFIMDALKTRAPFWKKEDTEVGARWVEGRSSDQAALLRW